VPTIRALSHTPRLLDRAPPAASRMTAPNGAARHTQRRSAGGLPARAHLLAVQLLHDQVPATRIVADLTVEGHADEDTWVTILHAQDGAWGIGGRSLTDEMLSSAPTSGTP